MEAYQQRVVDELTELTDKKVKLDIFIQGEVFPKLELMDQALLRRQLHAMSDYAGTLALRIERFK